jgi:hypothetical protein
MTLCFTPEHLGRVPHYTSPPKRTQDFADFAEWAVSRYAGSSKKTVAGQLELRTSSLAEVGTSGPN